MAALLQYDIAVIGAKNVDRALSGLERRFAQHNARIARIAGTGPRRGLGRKASLEAEAKKATRAAEQEAKAQARIAAQAERKETARQDRLFKSVERRHQREIRAAEHAGRRKFHLEQEFLKRDRIARSTFARRTIGNTAGRVGGATRAVGGAALALTGIAGAGLASAAIGQAGNVDEQIRRMLVGGREAGKASNFDADSLRKEVMRTSIKTGMGPEGIAAGMQKFVSKTGSVDDAVKFAETFATVAQATGGSVDEIAAAAAGLRNNLGITEINQMADALATLTFQGKKGSFEFKDMASLLERMTSGLKAKGVGGMGQQGVQNIGGIAQIVQTATGESTRTATAIDALFRQFIVNGKNLQRGKYGKKVNVFKDGDAKKGLREDMGGLISDVLKGTGGDVTKLSTIFGDEGMTALNPFLAKFRDAGGGQKGADAVTAYLKEYSDVTASYSEVQKDAQLVMQSTNVQLEIFKTQLMDVVASKVFPQFQRLTPKLERLIPAIGSLVETVMNAVQWFADNPFSGIGLLVGGALTTEITKAAIGDVISKGVLTPLGALGSAAGLAGAAILAFAAYIDAKYNEGKIAAGEAAARGDEIRKQAQSEIDATGTISPETQKKLEALRDTEAKTLKAADEVSKEGFGSSAGRVWNQWFTDDPRNLDQSTRLMGAATNDQYMEGVGETKRLLQVGELSKKYGPEIFKKAAEDQTAAAKELTAAAKALKGAAPNRGNTPSPVKNP